MSYVYLFEVKSIQQYLFSSGKLKDVISASERLDRLIDSDESSVLRQVLNAAGLESDIDDVKKERSMGMINFLRCKGGAFYAYCNEQEPLQQLRALWTLTVSQLFPSLVFSDTLAEGNTLQSAMEKGHQQLAVDRNTPRITLPTAL